MDMLVDHTLENSQDNEGDVSDGCLVDSKEIITAQCLTIVEEDGSLGSGEDQTAVAELAHTQGLLDAEDEDVQYQFRSGEGGTVTYRVVQVESGQDMVESIPQIVSTSPNFTTSPCGVQQAVLSSPINGQIYVIGSSQEMFATQNCRSLAPRPGIQLDSTRGGASRDDRRRATHNEVERRRRDKINNWIMKLSKIIPDCAPESAKSGQSKGGILSKACEYITELRSSKQRLTETLNDNKHLAMELKMLRQHNEELKRENSLLRSQLSQHGIMPSSPDLHNPVTE